LKRFALIGVAGYIAPRHLEAIRATGNALVAALDPHDSVGIIDRYFPDARYFSEYERFDRHLEKLRRKDAASAVDYVSICSPNYLHDAHVRQALRVGADAICEKPLTINPWNLDQLVELEQDYGRRVYNVLQLRVHPELRALRARLASEQPRRRVLVDLSYVTRRGSWYRYSWKGDVERSGGVATNIGVHFFDLLLWLFGPVQASYTYVNEVERMVGALELEWATVRWFLSIDGRDLPDGWLAAGKTAYRSLTMDGDEIEFSNVFADLHTEVYREVLAGRGHGIEDARASIELVHRIRSAPLATPSVQLTHPMLASLSR